MQLHNREYLSLNENIKAYGELLAAAVSGILIVVAWLLQTNGVEQLSIFTYIAAFLIGGYAKAKEGITETFREKKLNVEMLMIFAALGACITGYWAEGALLIFIFAVSGGLEAYALSKSEKELSALVELQPQEATRVIGDMHKTVAVSTLHIGDIVLVKPGERVPIDGEVLTGRSSIDEAALSGEAVPIVKEVGDAVFAGTMNINGALTIRVTAEASNTVFQQIVTLVEQAQHDKAPTQQFIEKFEERYVQAVLIIVGVMMFLPVFLFDWSYETAFYRAMVLLVVASPCALVAAVMPATLAAISSGAKQGILFKGGQHFEQLSRIERIVFDKTGTLTIGQPVVVDFAVDASANELDMLQLLGTIEKQSHHPLAQAIVNYAEERTTLHMSDVTMEDIPGFGLRATHDGHTYDVGKADFVGRDNAMSFLQTYGIDPTGKTLVFLANEQRILAAAALQDTVRDEAADAIAALKKHKITPVMLTGDNELAAAAVAKELGLTEVVANCLPQTKAEYIQAHEHIAMVGDGINDAPALALADVGIAMGKGTAVALQTADVALMQNDLRKIERAVRMSKKLQRIVKQNIIFSVTVIALLVLSNFLQIVNLPLGVIGHEGSTILVILNGLRMLRTN
ncbi:heavy metal translocating P-type ATPase [Caryophanon latum]|uniref:ATPase n=1 Tax=Caryophanon latum TaxID=33977 RepID=A0A1C0YW03_9BACL|nr:heavy metal translocating P-type ATPase [Caryophanon latum]OCS91356.1 ATPase [Caryophanon latum]